MHRLAWSLVFLTLGLTLGPESADGSLYGLTDAGRPGLTSEGQALSWADGGPAHLLASGRVVRVNFRGVHARPGRDLLPAADLTSSGAGWLGLACNVTSLGLCASEAGVFFPSAGPRQWDDPALGLAGWRDLLGCASGAGKQILHWGGYDVSACDVLDEGLDVVYCGGRVFARRTSLPGWAYWALVVLAIALVRALSLNLPLLGKAADDEGRQWPVMLASAASLLLVVLLDGDRVYVTGRDRAFFWATVAYVGVYLAFHAGLALFFSSSSRSQGRHPVYNLIAGSLQLVAVRLYTGAETPYNEVLLAIVAARVWIKLLRQGQRHRVSLLMDGAYLGLCLEVACAGDSREMLVGLFAAAFVAAEVLTTA